ncbi:MAG: GTPase domain-containing protein [Kofleriaceae bacterium]
MLTIAVLGPAYAGKSTALSTLRDTYGGELVREGVTLELRTTIDDEAVALVAVPGLVFEDAPREKIIGRADAAVFVVDSRPERYDQNLEMWEQVPKLLEAAGHKGNFPIVILYGHRDHAHALALDELEEALGIQAMMIHGEGATALRMPNPFALRYPARFEAVIPAFSAAVERAIEGPFPIDPSAQDFAMAMLDKQLGDQLAGLLGGMPGADKMARQALQGDAHAREQFTEAAKDNFMADLMAKLNAGDPALMAMLENEMMAMANGMMLVDNIKCGRCKADVSQFELTGVSGGPFKLGAPLGLELDALDPQADWLVTAPTPGKPFTWLTADQCKCGQINWCSLTVDDGAVRSAWPAVFTRETFHNAHIVSLGGAVMECSQRLGIPTDKFASLNSIRDAIERL